MHKTNVARPLPLFFALTQFFVLGLSSAQADPPVPPSNRIPDREQDLIQIVQDARDEAAKTHSYKNARMSMQIRIQNFYNQSHEFENFQGKVVGTHVLPNNDVWINIEIADGISVQTSPTTEDDPDHVTLIKGDTKLADLAGGLRNGQRVQFSATLMRFVNDQDESMLNAARMLAHFKTITPLN